MIVCVCSNISERKIRQAVDGGLTRMSELREQLKVGACCGKCHSCAKRVLREHLGMVQNPVVQPAIFSTMAVRY